MNQTIIYLITESVGNSCLSMRKVLSVREFTSIEDAMKVIDKPVNNAVDANKPYLALTSVENGCVHTCINFFQ